MQPQSYLRGTIYCGIWFPTVDEGNECKLLEYIDSSWCGDVDYRTSTTCFMCYARWCTSILELKKGTFGNFIFM